MSGAGRSAAALPLLAGCLLAVFLLFGGCGGGEPAVPDLAARVGERALAYDEFERYLVDSSADPGFGWGSDVLSALFDQFLDEELLRQLAVERGVVDEAASRRRAAERLLGEELREGVGEQQIAAYYRRHRQEFERSVRARVRQLLLPDRDAVDRALAELAAGTTFEELAASLSEESLGVVGDGDAALAAEDLPPAFAEVIFALSPGEVSAPVATDYGFHLFQLTELLPAGAPPLAAVADEIGDRLRRDLAERRLAELVGEARDRYNVRVFSRNLPFNYQGHYSDGSSGS